MVFAAEAGSLVIEGKTLEEAIVSFKNDINMVFGRVEKVEEKQIIFSNFIKNSIAELDKVKLKNQELENTLKELENKPKVIERVVEKIIEKQVIVKPISEAAPATALPPQEIKPSIPEMLAVYVKNFPRHDLLHDGMENVSMITLHLKAIGDEPIFISGFIVNFKGDKRFVNKFKLLNNTEQETDGFIRYEKEIKPEEEKILEFAVDINDDIRLIEPGMIGLSVKSVIVDEAIVSVSGSFPIESLFYKASSTRR